MLVLKVEMALARNKKCNAGWKSSRASGELHASEMSVIGRAAECPPVQVHRLSALAGSQTRLEPAKPHLSRKTIKDQSVQVSLHNDSLLEKNAALEKEVLQLKCELKEKDLHISSFSRLIKAKNVEHTEKINAERELHCQTKEQLQKAEHEVQEKVQMYLECTSAYEQTIKDLTLQHNLTISDLKEEMNSERIRKDENINKLKQQISDILQGNSWERQQQLEELQKEINRLTAETSALKQQLKLEQTPKLCKNCKSLQLILKEKSVEELQDFCKRFGK
ncbi:meiosis-specific nuclear structural protein 1-like [Amia ocellicauda]|uniref:meiosis-specific nuclear structural protein 1-like n=1 Tax=Amia ocellicauda TaxID=2972642 RepID=UPI00346395F6